MVKEIRHNETERPPRSQFHIRVLDDGTVVFVDLPPGLEEVAAIVAGSVSSDVSPGGDSDGDEHVECR